MPLTREVVVTVGGSGAASIVMLRLFDVDCGVDSESFARIVKEAVCAVVGVPEINPDAAFSVRPVGSEPEMTDHVYGETPPIAVSVFEYAVLTCPLGKETVVI